MPRVCGVMKKRYGRKCSINGCKADVYCRGWCKNHYARWYKHGDPLGGTTNGGVRPNSGRKPKPLKDRLRYEVCEETGCWEWSGNTSGGYGRVRHNGRYIVAHRGSYIIHVGEIPDGLLVCHHCDNRSCINPDHLFLGTHSENTQDMLNKGRGLTGEKSTSAKLCEVDVLLIRDLESVKPQQVIADWFGVCQAHVSDIIRRKTWKHI